MDHDTILRRRLTVAKRHAATTKRLLVRQRETVAQLRAGARSAASGRKLLRLLEELHELTLRSQRQANAALRRYRRN